MTKPRIFISSTVIDFADLRSALKYWLTEAGFDVQMSEHADFDKNSAINSYEACLETIASCDYFILLIGSRKGGDYNDGSCISITRKEYRVAYELVEQGKIKKIISFVRQSVLDVIEDRKVSKNTEPSKILDDPAHITDFVREAKRIDDMKCGTAPSNNWVNSFNRFDDIIDVLKVELRINLNISLRIAERNVKSATISNLRWIYNIEDGNIVNYFECFEPVYKKLLSESNSRTVMNNCVFTISNDELKNAFDFFIFFRHRIDRLCEMTFTNAVSSGVFLRYNKKTDDFTEGKLYNALIEISNEIRRAKKLADDITDEEYGEMAGSVKETLRSSTPNFVCNILTMWNYAAIYERFYNICALSKYIINFVDTRDENICYPVLLNGRVGDTRPSEDEILKLF